MIDTRRPKRASLTRRFPASKQCSKRHKEANESFHSRSSPCSNDRHKKANEGLSKPKITLGQKVKTDRDNC